MKYYVMNDYELIYLIQTNHDEHALEFMMKKYHRLIWKIIHILNIDSKEQDDFYQEGLLVLYKAIQTFNEKKNKTFTRYFELILKRHYYQMIQKIPKYILFEHTDFCKGYSVIEEEPVEVLLTSDIEKTIYQLYFEERKSITEIEKQTGYQRKQIYNSIFRIKEKYKMMV